MLHCAAQTESMMHHWCIAINLCCSDARLAATFNQFVSFSDQNLTSLALSTYRVFLMYLAFSNLYCLDSVMPEGEKNWGCL
jgi:hypothetical protein